jgi:hypothetical protein
MGLFQAVRGTGIAFAQDTPTNAVIGTADFVSTALLSSYERESGWTDHQEGSTLSRVEG